MGLRCSLLILNRLLAIVSYGLAQNTVLPLTFNYNSNSASCPVVIFYATFCRTTKLTSSPTN